MKEKKVFTPDITYIDSSSSADAARGFTGFYEICIFFPDDFDILPPTLALEFYTYAVGCMESSVVAL